MFYGYSSHYSLSCIFTSLGRMCWAPSALAYRNIPFSGMSKNAQAEGNVRRKPRAMSVKLAWTALPRCSRCSVKNAISFQAAVWPACNIFRSMFCIRKNDILYYLLSDNTLKVACFVFLSSSLWHSHRSLPISALHYGHLPQLLSHMFHIRSLFCHTTSSINPPTDLLLILSCLVHTIKFLRLLLN